MGTEGSVPEAPADHLIFSRSALPYKGEIEELNQRFQNYCVTKRYLVVKRTRKTFERKVLLMLLRTTYMATVPPGFRTRAALGQKRDISNPRWQS